MSSMGILSTSMGIRAISPLPEVTGMGKTHCMGNRASSPLPKKKSFFSLVLLPLQLKNSQGVV